MEQRRTKRFKLQLPLSVIRSGAERVAVAGRTDNISSSGVLFTMEAEPDLSGGSIEYMIELNREGAHTVHLRCVGKVVRLQRSRDGMAANGMTANPPACLVAATLERYEFVRIAGAGR